jgi:benzoate membrane transport protein
VLSASFAIFATYVFSLPLQVAVYHQLGLTNVEAASWLFITWLTTGVVSVAVALHYRQPLSINLTIPGLLYLGSLAGQFTLPEMVGANLTAGVIIIAIGRLRLSAKLMRWLPLPIVMGMFAGVLLGSVTRMVDATASDFWIAGPAVAGYLVARAIDNPRVPPIGLAALAAIAAALLAAKPRPLAPRWARWTSPSPASISLHKRSSPSPSPWSC